MAFNGWVALSARFSEDYFFASYMLDDRVQSGGLSIKV